MFFSKEIASEYDTRSLKKTHMYLVYVKTVFTFAEANRADLFLGFSGHYRLPIALPPSPFENQCGYVSRLDSFPIAFAFSSPAFLLFSFDWFRFLDCTWIH